jgi:hypothetical protein
MEEPMAQVKVTKANKEKPTILINFILDESGSMDWQRQQVISGFNEYLEDHKNKMDANYLITLVKFNDAATTVFSGKTVHNVRKISKDDYKPSGSTALRDAIGVTIHQADAVRNIMDTKPKVLTFIFTDGDENSSREFSSQTINQMVTKREQEGDWTFTFVGASKECLKQAKEYGIPSGNIIWYNASNTSGTISAMSACTSTYVGNVSRGLGSSATFFADSGIKSADDIDTLGAQVQQSRITGADGSFNKIVQPGNITTSDANIRIFDNTNSNPTATDFTPTLTFTEPGNTSKSTTKK